MQLENNKKKTKTKKEYIIRNRLRDLIALCTSIAQYICYSLFQNSQRRQTSISKHFVFPIFQTSQSFLTDPKCAAHSTAEKERERDESSRYIYKLFFYAHCWTIYVQRHGCWTCYTQLCIDEKQMIQ